MKFRLILAAAAIAAGAGLLIIKQPTLEDRLARIEPELDRRLADREVQIDPGELLDIIYNNNIALRIIDIREEADYNLFHIIDSTHATMHDIRDPEWVKRLPAETVTVLVSNDEEAATKAWKLLAAQKVGNIYILEGGINYWLDVYGRKGSDEGPGPDIKGNDRMRHEFTAALGANHPASDPDPLHEEKRLYIPKVKSIGPATRKTGGCG